MNARTTARRSAAGVLALLATVAATSDAEHRNGTSTSRSSPSRRRTSRLRPTTPSRWHVWAGEQHGAEHVDGDERLCGCSASGSAVTVVYVGRGRVVRADNVAHAWSTCVGCSSSAVSVQVVVLRRAGTLHAANRAFAANVACEGCTTSAVAYQLVVVAPRRGVVRPPCPRRARPDGPATRRRSRPQARRYAARRPRRRSASGSPSSRRRPRRRSGGSRPSTRRRLLRRSGLTTRATMVR